MNSVEQAFHDRLQRDVRRDHWNHRKDEREQEHDDGALSEWKRDHLLDVLERRGQICERADIGRTEQFRNVPVARSPFAPELQGHQMLHRSVHSSAQPLLTQQRGREQGQWQKEDHQQDEGKSSSRPLEELECQLTAQDLRPPVGSSHR